MNQNQQPQNRPKKQNQAPKKQKNQNLDQFSAYIKYSGLAFQMIVIIGLAVWGGLRIDDAMENRFPVVMILLALLAFGVSLYIVIKGLPKNK